MCNLVMVIGPCLVCIEWQLPLLPWVGEASATHSAVPQSFGGAYSLGGSVESHLIPLPSLHDGEGSSFPGLVPSDDVVNSESVMGIKPGDSSVVIGYQVDEFTHTWFAEWFVACSHIYPGFTGKVSSLTHFPLEPGCEDYAFLDQAVADFKQGLDSILTDSLVIYIFSLLSIIIISYVLFGIMCLISGRFYLLGLLQPLGFLCPSPNLFCSFAIANVCILLSIWMTSWSSFALNGWGHLFLCSLLVHLGLHINFSKSDLHLTQTFYFLGLC